MNGKVAKALRNVAFNGECIHNVADKYKTKAFRRWWYTGKEDAQGVKLTDERLMVTIHHDKVFPMAMYKNLKKQYLERKRDGKNDLHRIKAAIRGRTSMGASSRPSPVAA